MDDNSDKVIKTINLEEKSNLIDPNVGDNELLVPFSSLPPDAKPIKELPPDNLADVYYKQITETRCHLCKNTPLRVVAEHLYLDQGRKTSAVVKFFKEYYNAKISWETVDTHMKNHCDFSRIGQSGLKNIAIRMDDAAFWQYREMELAIAGLLAEIDDTRGMNVANNPDRQLKRSALLEKLYKTLIEVTAKRDEAASQTINIFAVLHDIWKEMPTEETKQIIVGKVSELKNQLMGEPEQDK